VAFTGAGTIRLWQMGHLSLLFSDEVFKPWAFPVSALSPVCRSRQAGVELRSAMTQTVTRDNDSTGAFPRLRTPASHPSSRCPSPKTEEDSTKPCRRRPSPPADPRQGRRVDPRGGILGRFWPSPLAPWRRAFQLPFRRRHVFSSRRNFLRGFAFSLFHHQGAGRGYGAPAWRRRTAPPSPSEWRSHFSSTTLILPKTYLEGTAQPRAPFSMPFFHLEFRGFNISVGRTA